MKNSGWFLLLLAFVEGAAVMVCELLGAKQLGVYFGSSLYAWSGVLGVTLGGLMIGYYLGGVLSGRKKDNYVFMILAIAGTLLAFMPTTGRWIMPKFIDYSVQTGTVLSLIVFMFPQLVLFGMTSPMIINALNKNSGRAGKMAGSVYAISTFGGIISTFLMGFYLLPNFGVDMPAVFFGTVLISLSSIGLFKMKKSIPGILSVALLSVCFAGYFGQKEYSSRKYKVVYSSEGILGQVKVVDQMFTTYTRGAREARILYVNNTAQSIIDKKNPEYSLWDWSYYMPSAASVFPVGSDVLLLGLGGGTLVKQFQRLGYNVEAVELDERIVDVTQKLFSLDSKVPITVDDGRHFINTTKNKYDLIALDLFHSETPPTQMISVEAFKMMKNRLNEGGMVIMNFYGYLTGKLGRSGRSVFRTFNAAGFDTKLLVTPGAEGARNLILLACTDKKDFTKSEYTEPGLNPLGDLTRYFVEPETLDTTNTVVLKDDIPVLEKMYVDCAVEWRKGVNESFTKSFIREKIR